jgi:type IV secretory pathway VirB2 component (pilin)
MDHNSKKKTEPWRIIVALISVAYIVFMWVKKDIAAIYESMPAEKIVPMIATTVWVSVLKVLAIAGVILAVKWIVGKIKNMQS